MSTTRRDILGGIGGTGLVAIAAAAFAKPDQSADLRNGQGGQTASIEAVSQDAELIAIGEEALPLVRQYRSAIAAFWALKEGDPDLNRVADLGDAPFERLGQLSERAACIKATTQAGYSAKALLLWHDFKAHHSFDGEFSAGDPELVLAWSLIGDLLPGGVA